MKPATSLSTASSPDIEMKSIPLALYGVQRPFRFLLPRAPATPSIGFFFGRRHFEDIKNDEKNRTPSIFRCGRTIERGNQIKLLRCSRLITNETASYHKHAKHVDSSLSTEVPSSFFMLKQKKDRTVKQKRGRTVS